MLIDLLKSLFLKPRTLPSKTPTESELFKATGKVRQYFARLNSAHKAANIDLHQQIQFGGIRVGQLELLDLVKHCLEATKTKAAPAKAFHRFQAALHLAQYFLHTIDTPGKRAECGVYTGFGSRMMCELMAAHYPGYLGEEFHMVDSFEGLSARSKMDAIETVYKSENEFIASYLSLGFLSAPLERVQDGMRKFPNVCMHKGWIPEILNDLPEATWAFVHIDVDLYEPTLACLKYFYPRLSPGGAILCDDYGSKLFPGAALAWNEVCEQHQIPFVALDTGQAIILKQSSQA